MTHVLTPPTDRATQPGRRTPGESGVWVFILTEMAIFTALFGVVVWNRAHNPEVFSKGQALLSQPLGLINTLVLIIGSAVVVLAIDAAQTDQYRGHRNPDRSYGLRSRFRGHQALRDGDGSRGVDSHQRLLDDVLRCHRCSPAARLRRHHRARTGFAHARPRD